MCRDEGYFSHCRPSTRVLRQMLSGSVLAYLGDERREFIERWLIKMKTYIAQNITYHHLTFPKSPIIHIPLSNPWRHKSTGLSKIYVSNQSFCPSHYVTIKKIPLSSMIVFQLFYLHTLLKVITICAAHLRSRWNYIR